MQLNLFRKHEAERDGDSPQLIGIFEGRMNRALEKWDKLHRMMGEAALLGGGVE